MFSHSVHQITFLLFRSAPAKMFATSIPVSIRRVYSHQLHVRRRTRLCRPQWRGSKGMLQQRWVVTLNAIRSLRPPDGTNKIESIAINYVIDIVQGERRCHGRGEMNEWITRDGNRIVRCSFISHGLKNNFHTFIYRCTAKKASILSIVCAEAKKQSAKEKK